MSEAAGWYGHVRVGSLACCQQCRMQSKTAEFGTWKGLAWKQAQKWWASTEPAAAFAEAVPAAVAALLAAGLPSWQCFLSLMKRRG